jgi:disulfide oxidoreductase YuzD
MNILYGICVYYGYYRPRNIHKHLEQYNRLVAHYPHITFSFVINLMIDNKDIAKRALIAKVVQDSFQYPITVLHNYNWGGTIVGLYDTYEYLYINQLYDHHVIYFEEDFYPTNLAFLAKSLEVLSSYDYVGEVTRNTPQVKTRVYKGEHQTWTDGGFYMSSYKKLDTIFKKVGCFHKGNKDTKYDHQIDGIELGEVGFPTLLHNAGFRFIGLPRNEYFLHNEH